jgi:GNAT superfamily N-acetyltransferase
MEAEPGFWQNHWSDATIEKAIAAAEGLALIWEEDAQIKGFVCAHDLGFRAYLSELIVASNARGRGVAGALLKHVETQLGRRGIRTLIADVWHGAEPFYLELGWEPPDVVLLRRRLPNVAG